jgi:hypothetical protein
MELTLPSEASARLQKMLEEVRAEARAGFGGKAVPWMRTFRQENGLGAVNGSHAESHHNLLSREAKAKILDALEAELLGDQPGHDWAEDADRREGEAAHDNQGNDVTAILAQSIASAILTDEQMRTDSGQGCSDEAEAEASGEAHVDGVHFDIEDSIRQAFEADFLQSRRGRRSEPGT